MPIMDTWWFTKSRRAQNEDDYETWIEGGVMPTMNAFDNGDIRTTILITTANVIGTLQARDYKGVGNQYVAEDKLIIEESIVFYGNRVADIRIQDNKVNTLQARMGTGGNNMPLVAFDTQFGSNATTFEDLSPTLKASQQSPSVQGVSGMAVRRLTPVECERLQGFPDNWTEGQSDSARYKQMGNAVAVPVVEWIISNICDTLKTAE
jgi:site-specific DNA-cytosine methylase